MEIDFNQIDETYSTNPITNIIHTFHVNKQWMGETEDNLQKQIDKLIYEKNNLIHPTQKDNFVKPIVDLVANGIEYTISIIYLTFCKSYVYRILFADVRTAVIYKNKWGDLCISGKEICEMDAPELFEYINNWVPHEDDPQMPKVY